jgi:hypothetical protein
MMNFRNQKLKLQEVASQMWMSKRSGKEVKTQIFETGGDCR